MSKAEKIKAEIDRLQETTMDNNSNFKSQYDQGIFDGLSMIDNFIDSLEEEPVSDTILLYGLSGSVGIEEAVKETEEYKEWQGDPERQQSFIDFAKFGANYKHHTSNDLEEVACEYDNSHIDDNNLAFKAGAQWQKENLWKDAQGDDLPEIDREVVVLVKSLPEYEDSLLKVTFAHRPPEYWEGKNIGTGEITRYEPKRYDKGQWNMPAVVWWLDVELPKEEE